MSLEDLAAEVRRTEPAVAQPKVTRYVWVRSVTHREATRGGGGSLVWQLVADGNDLDDTVRLRGNGDCPFKPHDTLLVTVEKREG